MSGFPTRPSRGAFGPRYENRGPVRQASKDLDADKFDLLCWQTSGLGVVGELAWALLSWSGGALSLAASGEAWDPDGGIVPTVARTGAGVYVVTYAATYPDRDAVAIATNLRAADPVLQGISAAGWEARATIASARIVTVRIWNGGVPDDASVLLKVR